MYWNESNLFPYDLFEWEGIDGSSVLAHLFLNPGHGYNGNIVPLDTIGTWRNYRSKTRHPESLLAFGWGDGAGGPSEKMLENYARLKDFPAMPRLRMGRVDEFYASVNREGLPRYVGELYFELHRGTLTTQGKTKKLNREAEHRLVEAETFGTIASLHGFEYPAGEIETAWKTVLLNQFHDVLPGSSIREVYEDNHRMLEEAVETATRVRDESLTHLGGGPGEGKFLVANCGLTPRGIRIQLPGRYPAAIVRSSDGEICETQETGDGLLVMGPIVPPLGSVELTLVSEAEPEGHWAPWPVQVERTESGAARIENDVLVVEIGEDGAIARLYDKEYERDALAERGNQIWAYIDKPRSWDAWDVDETYERDGEEVVGVERVEITEAGPLRASVRVERKWRDSTIVQTYRLWTGTRRLDIETEIDWHERQVLLRARFPFAVHAHEATFETAFGAVRRPTHRNSSNEQAQFEGSGHRFGDISETGYGVALLNDGKYGYGAHGSTLSLSLLRSPLYPDALADEGQHRFTYSLLPHAGRWTEADVVSEAIDLNSPLAVVPIAGSGATNLPFLEFVEPELELHLAALKPAFDGDGLILRMYEPHGRRGPVTIRFSARKESVERVNLLEESVEAAPVELTDDGSRLNFQVRPFEIITLRIRQ